VSERDAVARALQAAQRIAIVLHELPDGDCTGSGLGLMHLLTEQGKTVRVLAPDPIPPPYRFLPGALEQTTFEAVIAAEDFDAVVTVDCGDPGRCLGLDKLRRLAPVLVNIDHHRSNRRFGDVNWVDSDALAVGQMILTLADAWGMPLSLPVALCLYVSLVMDTEGLRFGYHDATLLEQAARLVRVGLDPDAISRQLWEQRSLASVKALGWALSRTQVLPSGRVAWIALPASALKAVGAAPFETEGVVNYLRAVQGVQLAAVLREEEPGPLIRISLRSQLPWEASRVALELGGGGHPTAAGARLETTLPEAVRRLLAAVEQLYGEPIPWTALPPL
jgi:phosphoesterase RecJ-like protein